MQINLHIPATILVSTAGECVLMYSDAQGWVLTEPKFEAKKLRFFLIIFLISILDMIKGFFEDSSSSATSEEQKYIAKTYEPISNTNISITYNNKYIMMDDMKNWM